MFTFINFELSLVSRRHTLKLQQCLMAAQTFKCTFVQILGLIYVEYASISHCEPQWGLAVRICVSIRKYLENTVQHLTVTLKLFVAS